MGTRIAAAAGYLALLVALILSSLAPQMPSCEEDEYIQGRGAFESGYWSEYVCQHDAQ